MKLRAPAVLGICLACLAHACAPAAAPKPAEVAAPIPSPPGASPVASSDKAVASGKTASEELTKRWSFGEKPKLAIYADLAGLFRAQLLKSVMPAFVELAKGTLTEPQMQCVRDVAAGAKELLVGAGEDDEQALVLLRFDEAVKPAGCLAVAEAKPFRLEGAAEAFSIKEMLVVHEPGLLLLGREGAVKAALRARSASPLPAALTLAKDQFVAWSARPEEGPMRGGLIAADDRFRVDAEAELPEKLAKRLEQQFNMMKKVTAGGGATDGADETAVVASLMQGMEVTRNGGHVKGSFELRGSPPDQAVALGRTAAIAIHAVRKYIASAKTAEARNTIGHIAKIYTLSMEGEDGKVRPTKKLVSFPAVPKTVPRGVKFQSAPGDWKAWEPIQFSMDLPQYFQYEVRAAKDGQSAEIFARGDLDGDGKPSLFRLQMKVDRSTGHIITTPSIEETDPEE